MDDGLGIMDMEAFHITSLASAAQNQILGIYCILAASKRKSIKKCILSSKVSRSLCLKVVNIIASEKDTEKMLKWRHTVTCMIGIYNFNIDKSNYRKVAFASK